MHFCLLAEALPPIYLFLSFIAIASFVIPFLRDLASHGKCRSSADNTGRLHHKLLHGETFLVPKRYFLHFYVTGLFSTAALYTYSKHQEGSNQNSLALALLIAHLARRCWECLFVHAWSPTSRMHIAGYALGIMHYVLLPLVFVDPVCDGVQFHYTSDLRTAILGTCIWLWAQYQQYRHHCLLAGLRSVNSPNDYTIPTQGWFCLISCPHYLAEIIIYISFAVVLHSRTRDYRSVALVIWVATNLSVSAIRSHDWYLLEFPEYASFRRKAIFPFLL